MFIFEMTEFISKKAVNKKVTQIDVDESDDVVEIVLPKKVVKKSVKKIIIIIIQN